MLGSVNGDGEAVHLPSNEEEAAPAKDDETRPCLYSAPNWYQSHIIHSNVQFSPDEISIAYGARSMVQILSAKLSPTKLLVGHGKRVSSVCWIGADKLVSGCDDGAVNIWDVTNSTIITSLIKTPIPITVVRFRSNPDYLFTGDEKGYICFWSCLEQGKELRYQICSEKILTMECSNHADKVYLAVGYRQGTLAVFSVMNKQLTVLHKLKGHNSDVFCAAWCPSLLTENHFTSLLHDKNTCDIIFSVSKDKTVKCWDGVNNAFIRSFPLPRSLSRENNLNKEQPWSSLLWTDATGLVATSATGDLATLFEDCKEDGLSETTWKPYNTTAHHTKKVFSLCWLGNNSLISASMNRDLILWDNCEVIKIAHGLTGFAYGLDISPLSPNRIAVAVGDNMMRVWEPYQNKVIQVWQEVRTKVMSVAWHPYKEGVLAFGTEEGKCGIYDVNTGNTHSSVTFHNKAVYSLCWGFLPTKYADDDLKTGLYSCGGEGTVYCHRPKELQKEAINVNSYIAAENMYKNAPPGRTAIAWEFEAKLLAVGCSTGLIEVFKAPNLTQIYVFQYHTRIVNRLRWGRNEHDRVLITDNECPDGNSTDKPQLLLASCSDDNRVCVYEVLPDHQSSAPILRAHRCLTGHTGRITDIDWNPHDFQNLVSTSYDGTAQVWDVVEGVGISNYRGHAGRLYSVRWSHTHLNRIYTGSEEFTVRQWRVEDNEDATPPPTNLLFPSGNNNNKKKKKKSSKKKVVISEEFSSANKASSRKSEETPSTPPIPRPKVSTTFIVNDARKKKPNRGKSILPLASRIDHSNKEEQSQHILQIARELQSSNTTDSSAIQTGLYSTQQKAFELINAERDNHRTERHHHQTALLGIWSNDITNTVLHAIETRSVTESLLAFSVYTGMELYVKAVKCYIEQLKSNRDYISAASYLLVLGETYSAINLLLSEELYREAIAISKLRLDPTDKEIGRIYGLWGNKQEQDLQFDTASKCYLASGDPERAILVLLKRRDAKLLEDVRTLAEITKQLHLIPDIERAIVEAKAALAEETLPSKESDETNQPEVVSNGLRVMNTESL